MNRWALLLYVISGIWQTNGYNAVIYLAALSTVDSELVEVAMIDGATNDNAWYIIFRLSNQQLSL